MSNTQSHTPKKYQYIDIMRGIGILGVVAVHTSQSFHTVPSAYKIAFNYGQLGVQMFFVASAITLCHSMATRQESTPYKFYIRRFFRIAPLYYSAILLYFLWRTLKAIVKGDASSIGDGYSLVAVLENIFFIHGFDWRNYNFIVPGGWSIATEMAFYAIFPLLFILQSRLGLRRFTILTIIITCASLGVQLAWLFYVGPLLLEQNIIGSIQSNDQFGFIYASILNQIPVFLIGIITYMLLGARLPRWTLLLALGLLALGVFLQSPMSFKTGVNGLFYATISAIAFSIIALHLANVKQFDKWFAKAMGQIGKHSFSMYILHYIVLNILDHLLKIPQLDIGLPPQGQLIALYVITIVATYIGATITHKYIEKPGVRFGKRFT